MSNKRLPVPESLVFYLLGFITLVVVLVTGLVCYYYSPSLEERFGSDYVVFFDITAKGNVLNWFYSSLWLVVVIEAFMVFLLARENQHGFFHQVFWLQVALVAILLSANSICDFFPLLCRTFDTYLTSLGMTDSSAMFLYSLLKFVLLMILLMEIWFARSFTYHQKSTRFFLNGCIYCCIATFGFAWFCHTQIPSTPFQSVSPPRGLLVHSESELESNNPFRLVSWETTAASLTHFSLGDNKKESTEQSLHLQGGLFPCINNEEGRQILTHWEQIFGWDRPIEMMLGLTKDIETVVGMNVPFESAIWPKGKVEVDLQRLRSAIRYGMVGFALITLCTTIGLIARGGRMRVVKRQQNTLEDILNALTRNAQTNS